MGKTKDLLQKDEKLEEPEIRVWIHDAEKGDHYETFETLKAAREFIRKNENAEDQPLVAYQGYEYTPDHFLREKKKETKEKSELDKFIESF